MILNFSKDFPRLLIFPRVIIMINQAPTHFSIVCEINIPNYNNFRLFIVAALEFFTNNDGSV